jgi:hypothetical protein
MLTLLFFFFTTAPPGVDTTEGNFVMAAPVGGRVGPIQSGTGTRKAL